MHCAPLRRCRPGLLRILPSGPGVERAGAGAPGRRPPGSAGPPAWPAGRRGRRRPARRAPVRRSPAAPRRAPERAGAPAPSASTGPTTMPAACRAAAVKELPASVCSLRDLEADNAQHVCACPSCTLRAPRPHLGLQRLRARLAALQAVAERVHGQAGRADALQLGLQVLYVSGSVHQQAVGRARRRMPRSLPGQVRRAVGRAPDHA